MSSRAWIPPRAEDNINTGHHHLLIRRNDTTAEHAYLRCYSPRPATLHTLVRRRRVALAYRRIMSSRQRPDRHRPIPSPALDLLAPLDYPCHARHRFLAMATAAGCDIRPTPTGLIALTVDEFRHLFDTPCWPGHAADDNNGRSSAYEKCNTPRRNSESMLD
jgi:hypothetical protein